jgi:flagellar basal body rod protein FlgG
LVTITNKLPVLGEEGPIYLKSETVNLKNDGTLRGSEGEEIDKFRIVTFTDGKGLWGYQSSYFYIRDPQLVKIVPPEEAKYGIIQGHYERSNENIGTASGRMDRVWYEALTKVTKHVLDSYDQMYRAVGPER